jgi:uncharacterized protein YjbI with pentapeptide repeats
MARRSWKDSLGWLQGRGYPVPDASSASGSAGLSARPDPGVADFRGLRFVDVVLEEVDFEDLTLPRTLFDRCRVHGVSFRNTDLNLSCLDGNDWIDCDFTDAVLICAYLRKAVFFGCRFVNCQLIGADLRGATLTGCDFTGANLTGARLDRALKDSVALNESQSRLMVDWRAEDDEIADEEDEQAEDD